MRFFQFKLRTLFIAITSFAITLFVCQHLGVEIVLGTIWNDEISLRWNNVEFVYIQRGKDLHEKVPFRNHLPRAKHCIVIEWFPIETDGA